MQDVHARIADAVAKVSRDVQSVRLLAVSKTFDAQAVVAAAQAGQREFGENYLQEALEKIDELTRLQNNGDLPDGLTADLLKWHFIGPIQSNKTRPLAERFDWVHAVDRLKIAQRLSEQRPAHLPSLNICIQVNISGEDSKSGVSPAELQSLAHEIAALPRLHLRGLMAIPAASEDPAARREPFHRLHVLYRQLQDNGLPLDTLSIGMSADLEAAIAEGATIVRIGSAIFGQRDQEVKA